MPIQPYFEPDNVSQVFYINLERSTDRRERMEAMGRDLGQELTRVEGCDGAALSKKLPEIIQRVKVDTIKTDRGWQRRVVDDQLIPEGIDIPDAVKKSAAGVYGCQVSHLRAMKAAREAIRHMPEEDQNKWVVILEDDALLKNEDRQKMNEALANAPDDAGALMLVASHRFDLGAVLIDTGNADWAKPVRVNCTMGIAFRKDMLDIMIPLYERNLAMRREEGGMLPVDGVNWVAQQALLGMKPYRGKPEHRKLAHAFTKLAEGKQQKHFYCLNPALIQQGSSISIIGSEPILETRLYYGQELQTFSEDLAIRLFEEFEKIPDENHHLRLRCQNSVSMACLQPTLMKQAQSPHYDHGETVNTAIAAFQEMNDPVKVLELLQQNLPNYSTPEEKQAVVCGLGLNYNTAEAQAIVSAIEAGNEEETIAALKKKMRSPEECAAYIKEVMGSDADRPEPKYPTFAPPESILPLVQETIAQWHKDHPEDLAANASASGFHSRLVAEAASSARTR